MFFFLEPDLRAYRRLLFWSSSSSDSDSLGQDFSELVLLDRSLRNHRDDRFLIPSSHASESDSVKSLLDVAPARFLRLLFEFFLFLLLSFLRRLSWPMLPSSLQLVSSFNGIISRLSQTTWPSRFCTHLLFCCTRRDGFQRWPGHEGFSHHLWSGAGN